MSVTSNKKKLAKHHAKKGNAIHPKTNKRQAFNKKTGKFADGTSVN